MGVLIVVLYAHNAYSIFLDQSFLFSLTIIFKFALPLYLKHSVGHLFEDGKL